MSALFKSTAVYYYQQKNNVDNSKDESSILEIKSNDYIKSQKICLTINSPQN